MLAHNSDRLGAIHGARHRCKTKLWQKHKHRLNEDGVVVNDNNTSVPLKRHRYLSYRSRGATPASDMCVNVRPQLAKGALLAAIICARPRPKGLQIIDSDRSRAAAE